MPFITIEFLKSLISPFSFRIFNKSEPSGFSFKNVKTIQKILPRGWVTLDLTRDDFSFLFKEFLKFFIGCVEVEVGNEEIAA